MNNDYNNEQMNEEEINLRELFMALWKKKVIILCISLIAAIIAGLISVFLISPVYTSKLDIIIKMPGAYHTKYGDYDMPITTYEQYIDLIISSDILLSTMEDMEYGDEVTIEKLRNRIIIDKPDETDKDALDRPNSFSISVTADNPKEAKELADTLYENYIDYINVLAIENALNHYINTFNVALSSLEVSMITTKNILAKNEELFAITPETISEVAAMEEIQEAPAASNYIILENIINPNYTKLETDIITDKQSISSMEETIRNYNDYLVEIDILMDTLSSYKESEDYSGLSKDFISLTETNLYLSSEPYEPSQKTSPSNAKNAIIGALLGGVVSVVAVLIKEYLFVDTKDKKESK